ncbi:DNA fragmentation factor subunit alpha-like [Pyxicephalus adspersus]|uniref:DNA fragmentation factor subunit alpha-like n=1 Tax=Pyxicephalus adspersus TaxID=30357 RepID=UPI003B58FE96
MKHCVIRERGSKVRHGVLAATLPELMEKALQVLNLNTTRSSVSLVLAENGTKVDSNDFFLCLPENTEFLALTGSKKWTRTKKDGGTVWMEQDSIEDVNSAQLPMGEEPNDNYPRIILYSASDDTDVCTDDAKTMPLHVNGNVQNVQQSHVECQKQQQTNCENTSLLSSIYRVAKEKLSPKLQKKRQVTELQGKSINS